jgi:hypothetical protein
MIPAVYTTNQPIIIKEGLTHSIVRIDQWNPKSVSFVGIKNFGGQLSVELDNSTSSKSLKKISVSNLSVMNIEKVLCVKDGSIYYCSGEVSQGEINKELETTGIRYTPGIFSELAHELKKCSFDEISAELAADLISALPLLTGKWFNCAILIYTDKKGKIIRSGEPLQYPTRSFVVVALD